MQTFTSESPVDDEVRMVLEGTDRTHAFSGEPLTPGLVRWIDETPGMGEDIGEWFLPMDQDSREDGTPVVLIGAHDYRGPYCAHCGMLAMEWDLQEYPCNR